MTSMTAWAVVSDGKIQIWPDGQLGVWKTKVKRSDVARRDRVVRVRIEEIPPQCRSGCAMVDDVPVFCRRHKP